MTFARFQPSGPENQRDKPKGNTLNRVRKYCRPLLATGVLLMLGGCGGGSGGTGASSAAPDPSGIALLRSLVACTAEPGAACDDSVDARPISSYVDSNFVWAETPAGGAAKVIDNVEKVKQADGTWRMKVTFHTGQLPGNYSGSIKLDLLNPFSTPPSSTLNYSYTVNPATGKLTALARLPGVPEWQGFGANAGHTGALALTLDPSKFSRRWSRASEPNARIRQMVVADGNVYLTRIGFGVGIPGDPALQAYKEADNSALWRVAGPASGYFASLAAAGGQVLMRENSAQGRLLRAVDETSGAARFSVKQADDGVTATSNEFAPAVSGALVCAGSDSAVLCHDAVSGALRWSAALRAARDPLFSNWTPAQTDSLVLTNLNGKFSAFGRADGSLQFQLDVPGTSAGTPLTIHELNQAPVLVDANSVLLLDQRGADGAPRDNTMSMVDLGARKLRWQASGQFSAHPVSARGVVYAGNHATQSIEARDGASGALLWRWALPAAQETGFRDNLVLTNNLLFVAGSANTYAIDLTTHQSVWSYPVTGTLALSSQGVLYILSKSSSAAAPIDWLVAINTQ